MAEYIERSAAIEAAKHAWAKGLEPSQYIEALPAADVAPVVHGCFEPCFDENGNWRQGFAKCSNCGKEYYAQVINHFGYCPNCGAKMDGERKDGGADHEAD